MSLDTLPFDIYESIQTVGSEMTQWLMGMHKGFALLIYVNDAIADLCEFGDSYDHEWDSPVTLHYAHRNRWE